jgi:hypothetical protein
MKLAVKTCTAWFAKLDRVREGVFFGKSKERNQPITPRREIFSENSLNAKKDTAQPPESTRSS